MSMQQRSCEELQLYISKYADGEATPEEREAVDLHISTCTQCACKLTEYMELAAIFSEMPMRSPEPELRTGLFRQIDSINEDARRKVERRIPERPWYIPAQAPASAQNLPFLARLWRAATPFAAAAVALFAFLVLSLASGNWNNVFNPKPQPDLTSEAQPPLFVPTAPPPTIAISSNTNGTMPGPVGTQVNEPAPILASASAVMRSTATTGDIQFKLGQPTPVMEAGDPTKLASWHLLMDPAYGYTAYYPPNWWSRVQDNVRFFYPWGPGGTS
jgi:hypothetical protein